MNTKPHTLYQGIFLDHKIVNDNELRGWREWIWFFFGCRTYARNTHHVGYFVFYAILLFIAAGLLVLFHVIQSFLLMYFIVLPAHFAVIIVAIYYSNLSRSIGFSQIIIGLLGLMLHVQFGFSVFGFHLEKYLFDVYFISGVVGVLRRCWNAIIWKLLDRIAIDYHIQKGYIMKG